MFSSYLIGAFFKLSAVNFPFDDVVNKRLPFHEASPLELTTRSTASFSHTFFLGFKTSSAFPVSYPSTSTFSPG